VPGLTEGGLFEQNEQVARIAGVLVDNAPEGWERIALTYRVTRGVSSPRLEVVTSGGATTRMRVPAEVSRRVRELRATMYEEGVGTWFTIKLTVDQDGRYQTHYDYDNEPDFTPALPASAYALDLEHFPRDEEHTPAWLREKLEQARNEEQE
jgi:hypothetical protein